MAKEELVEMAASLSGSEQDEKYAGTRNDREDMYRMGKIQELRRNFSFTSIFGFAAGLMLTWAGVFTYELPNGGLPAMIWLYIVGLFGFGAAIFSMAEMASMAPTSGGQYHWVSEFAPPRLQKILSYVVGWFCVLGWQAGLAGQCFTVALEIQGLIVLNDINYIPQAWHAVLLTIGCCLLAVSLNTVFIRVLPILETGVLILLVSGFIAILSTLWATADYQPSSVVWLEWTQYAGWPTDGLAALVAFTGPIFVLIGPDAAVHMSEEVQDASRVVPRSMIATLFLNSITGLVMSITFAYCIGPLDQANAPVAQYGFAFIGSFYSATGSQAGTTVMTCIIAILTLCSAIANLATASRQMFAFARDGGLPGFLCYVSSGLDVPLNAILISFLVTTLLSLINLGSTVTFNAILSIGIVSLLTSYITSMGCILLKRIRREELLPRRWKLSPVTGWILNIIGFGYLVVAYIFAFFPLFNDPTLQTMNWACVVYGGVGILAALYYIVRAKHRYTAPVAKLAQL